ncbi:hypothetical protein [Anaerotruncus rubiinfantis]|uniref:hypothetical protein n=1 Tax=Anaerotruncus rubiinfantis TaxID=1720200 RepID=UPI0011CA7822|nr:hypothetical protein [Anaerotruncus rubiinfantis]
MTNTRNSDILYANQNGRQGLLLRLLNEVIFVPTNPVKPGVPEDFSGALSELLPQLMEKYSRDTVRAQMNECSRLLSAVQECNARMLDSSADGGMVDSAVQDVVSSTKEYYEFLSHLPEDMRRFLILMGNVTSDEIEDLLALEPDVGDEISRLASVAPAIQAVRPKNYVMPIDPITSKLAQLREFNEITVSHRRSPTIQTAVTIAAPEHMKIDGNFQLTNYDKSIINGVVSILESGNSSFTVPMLYHAMTGKENPTVDDGLMEEIKAKLDTMRRLSINIDLTEEIKAHMIKQKLEGPEGVESFTIDGYLLPLNKYTGVVNGKRSEMYQIIDTPPLHSYAKLKNQITTVPIDLLKAPLNNNATTIPLKTYLLGRIEAMKNEHNKIIRDVILFESVYRELGDIDSDKKRKKRIRDYTEIVLTHFVSMHYITKYEIIKDGRMIKGVKIFWEGKKKK